MDAQSEFFTEEQFATIYYDGYSQTFWNLARYAVFQRKIARVLAPDDVVLDVGCGRGGMVEHLRKQGWSAYGCEPAKVAPSSLETIPYLFTEKRPVDLPAEFLERVRGLLFLDVLEHVSNPLQLVRETMALCPNAKFILIAVPARSELWTNFDTFNGHHLRYDWQSLTALCESIPSRRFELGYFFHTLYLVLLARIILSGRERPLSYPLGKRPASIFFESVLAKFCSAEELILPRKWLGSSIYAVIER